MVEMQCMLQTTPTTLLMAGLQDKLIELDLTEGVETNYVSYPTKFHHNSYFKSTVSICVAVCKYSV